MPNFVPFKLGDISSFQKRALLKGGSIRLKHGHYGTGPHEILVQKRFHSRAHRAHGRGGGVILRSSDMNMRHAAKGCGLFGDIWDGIKGAADKVGNFAKDNPSEALSAAQNVWKGAQNLAKSAYGGRAKKGKGGGILDSLKDLGKKAIDWGVKNPDKVLDYGKKGFDLGKKAIKGGRTGSAVGGRVKWVKGSAEAKAHMARLRAMRGKGGNTGSAR